jgi:hypothetical protein
MVLNSLATISLVFGAPSMPYGSPSSVALEDVQVDFWYKNIHLMSIDFRMLLSK